MRWITFTIFALAAVILETGLRNLWAFPDPLGHAPSLTLILLIFLGLRTPAMTLAWVALILGILVDLKPPAMRHFYHSVELAPIVGPAALGYLAGAYACLQARPVFFRNSPFSIAVLVFFVGLFVNLVIVAMLALRGLPVPLFPLLGRSPILDWNAADQLLSRFLDLLYTTAIALPVAWALLKTERWWGLDYSRSGRP
jgi:hypothetical protein